MLLLLCENLKVIELSQRWGAFEMVLNNSFSLENSLLVKKFLGIKENGLKHTKADEVYS